MKRDVFHTIEFLGAISLCIVMVLSIFISLNKQQHRIKSQKAY